MAVLFQKETNRRLPYESSTVRSVTGPTIRPGGLTLTRRATAFCGLGPGTRILDVGCGTGATLDFLESEVKARVVGIDLSAKLLSKNSRQNRPLALVRGDAQSLPVKSACLDAVFCECVLSLLASPASALADFSRVLRPDGYLILTDLYWRASPIGKIAGQKGAGGCLVGAVGRETLEEWVTSEGFELRLWEDHSNLLKRLAAQMAWAGISLRQWWGATCARPPGPASGRSGYFLMIARTRNADHG